MMMHVASLLAILLAVLPSSSTAEVKPAPNPCTIHSPSTGSYYDLRPLDLSLQHSSKANDDRTVSWYAKGHDYPSNFSLNICGPVIESLENVNGIPSSRWGNVSAFYKSDKDSIYSIGQSNSELVFRGRKLVLNYTGGSLCPDMDDEGNPVSADVGPRKLIGGDNDDHRRLDTSRRRKSTLLSLHCDRDPSVSTYPSLSFLGTLDHCVYVFEARSRFFCGGATSSPEAGSLGPGGVFGIIILIALLTYLVGGCAYQRIVMRQRGWRQCPTYGVWMSAWGFVTDLSTILLSSCLRRLPSSSLPLSSSSFSFNRSNPESTNHDGDNYRNNNNNSRSASYLGTDRLRRTYSNNNNNSNDNDNDNTRKYGRRGRTGPDEENRLIDQLDEEWDD